MRLGSCGLHAIHGAPQTGHNLVKWNVSNFLQGISYLFKDSEAERAGFKGLTNGTVLPKKFWQL